VKAAAASPGNHTAPRREEYRLGLAFFLTRRWCSAAPWRDFPPPFSQASRHLLCPCLRRGGTVVPARLPRHPLGRVQEESGEGNGNGVGRGGGETGVETKSGFSRSSTRSPNDIYQKKPCACVPRSFFLMSSYQHFAWHSCTRRQPICNLPQIRHGAARYSHYPRTATVVTVQYSNNGTQETARTPALDCLLPPFPLPFDACKEMAGICVRCKMSKPP
jgi:hypothetical protein